MKSEIGSNAGLVSRVVLFEPATLHERIYWALRADIIAGKFFPGETISIRKLAGEIGCSSVPVRDALGRLVAERALDMPNPRAFRIPLMSFDEFCQLNEFRQIAEGYLIERSAGAITDHEIQEIRAIDEMIEDHIEGASIDEALQENVRLMFLIYHAARLPILIPHIEGLWLRSGPYLKMRFVEMIAAGHHASSEGYLAQRQMIDALSARDGKRAREALVRDFQATVDIYLSEKHFAAMIEKT